MRGFRVAAWLGCVALMGCYAPDGAANQDSFADEMPEPLPAGQCDTEGSAEDCETEAAPDPSGPDVGGGDAVDACGDSAECDGGFCVAEFDPETLERGASECAFNCVATLNDSQWCVDAAACCDPAAVCTDRGYCVVPSDGETRGDSSSGGDTDTETDTDTDTTGGETDGPTGTDSGTGG